jgi:hypothetical protein
LQAFLRFLNPGLGLVAHKLSATFIPAERASRLVLMVFQAECQLGPESFLLLVSQQFAADDAGFICHGWKGQS